jgi:hypothetical protein
MIKENYNHKTKIISLPKIKNILKDKRKDFTLQK